MQVAESRGELKLLTALQREGLMRDCSYQEVIVLKATVPDFCWRKYKLVAYLDGPPHLKDRVMERDAELRELLRGLGWRVLEFPYVPPLSDSRLKEITTSIQEALPH